MVIMVVTYILKVPILRSFGSTEETFQYANDYLNIILAGTLFSVVGFSLNNVIRSEGNARIAMISMILSAGTNIILDPIFIFGFGWGVKGAAWATVISMLVLMVWVLAHFLGKRSVIKLRKENIGIDFGILKEIIGIGMAPFTMQIAGSFVQGLINKRLISFGGDLAAGSMGIINSVVTLIVMVIIALNMASQPIIGFNYGAKAIDRVKTALRISIVAASVFSVVSFILIQFFSGVLIRLFNSSSIELFEITRNGLSLATLALPIVGFQVVASHFFQSIGKARLSLFATLFRQIIMLVPLLLILPGFWDINGIWLAFPISDTMSATVVSLILISEWKKLNLYKVPEYIETDNISDSFV
jgi:putative MATE family efflux protein